MAGSPDFTPPQELLPHRRNYAEVAQGLFELLRDLCDVTPGDRVLDVGCGAGRLAGPLTGFLGPAGSYEGFDSSAERIDWCNEHIAPHHPGFRFSVADVHNGQYNPDAETKASEYTFPYGDGGFDVAFLTSVFTHMLPDDVAHYLDEIARVLKPGGRSLITWFLLNDEAERLLGEQRDRRHDPASNAHDALLSHDLGPFRTTNPRAPEHVVAYYEPWVRDAYDRSGLEIVEPVHYGAWAGRTQTLHNQDVVLARRPG
jgi:ubiquinone/menaquinone biosynthesis C-methylase UbiE